MDKSRLKLYKFIISKTHMFMTLFLGILNIVIFSITDPADFLIFVIGALNLYIFTRIVILRDAYRFCKEEFYKQSLPKYVSTQVLEDFSDWIFVSIMVEILLVIDKEEFIKEVVKVNVANFNEDPKQE